MKPRKQTYTNDMYLAKMKDMDIRSDADVQRLSGAWTNEMVNELIVTVLTDDYIPPIILGEENNGQMWVIDGLQRSTSLMKFRYGNCKITKSIEDPVIPYRAKKRDENGKIITDDEGNIAWEEVTFDIKGKTYSDLPDELKKKFNEYQIETVIHEKCSMDRITKLIKRYNNHVSMNNNQKAFTRIGNFARTIRSVTRNDFFVDGGSFSEKDHQKGVLESVVMESIMTMFHLDDMKAKAAKHAEYLNEHGSEKEFETLNNYLTRLTNVVNGDTCDMFNSKDTFLWVTLFHKFNKYGLEDSKFIDFMSAFKRELHNVDVDGDSFDVANEQRNTKDISLIKRKLDIMTKLMERYLQPTTSIASDDKNLVEFVGGVIGEEVSEEDVELYQELLDGLTLNVDNNSKLLNSANNASLIAIVGYACKMDFDLDEWIVAYFAKNKMYLVDQKKNFEYMKKDVDKFFLKNAS